jgi:hypothetical protein
MIAGCRKRQEDVGMHTIETLHLISVKPSPRVRENHYDYYSQLQVECRYSIIER